MHFKNGILGIWLKYNIIPPRYYIVPNYGIQIQDSIHVLGRGFLKPKYIWLPVSH